MASSYGFGAAARNMLGSVATSQMDIVWMSLCVVSSSGSKGSLLCCATSYGRNVKLPGGRTEVTSRVSLWWLKLITLGQFPTART